MTNKPVHSLRILPTGAHELSFRCGLALEDGDGSTFLATGGTPTVDLERFTCRSCRAGLEADAHTTRDREAIWRALTILIDTEGPEAREAFNAVSRYFYGRWPSATLARGSNR